MPISPGTAHKARVFITGSADGLGYAVAKTLLDQGHDVVVHVRSKARLVAVNELVDRGAIARVGDLSDLRHLREQARSHFRMGERACSRKQCQSRNEITGQPRFSASARKFESGSTATGFATCSSNARSFIESL